MSTDANQREFSLIEAASAGDVAAAGALLDHLREHDEEALADELAPLLAIDCGARAIAGRLAMHRINLAVKTVSVPIANAFASLSQTVADALAPAVAQMARIDWSALAAAAQAAQQAESPPAAAVAPKRRGRPRKADTPPTAPATEEPKKTRKRRK
jgi:hypothetical protein